MQRATLWLIAIALLALGAVALLRATDGEPGVTAPPPDASSPSTAAPTASTTSEPPVPTTTTVATPPVPEGSSVCSLYGEVMTTGVIASDGLVEASGLAASRTTSGVLWSHNDSRGNPELFAFDESGGDLGVYAVPDAVAFDWEDIAAGPGPDGSGAYLYVGDIGDNFDIRGGGISVYRVPDLAPADLEGRFPETMELRYTYPSGARNAEALFIDPLDPALYVVTKNRTSAEVFRGSLDPSRDGSTLELVATLPLGAEVSGADISRDGRIIALRGYQTVWLWQRTPGTTIADAFAAEPCEAPTPEERQGESIAFDADGSYRTTSEGEGPEIHLVPIGS